MKKSLLALAALTAFAGAASAQSSVTLFGLVDLSMRQLDYNGTQQSQLATDGNASSRWGMRGIEDLGGGLKAGFHLEGSLSADTGTQPLASIDGGSSNAAAIFQRKATVSLMGGFGEVRLGRDYTPAFWNWTIFDPFGANGVGASTNLGLEVAGLAPGGSYGTLVRANNTVGYFLPAMGGLYGQVMVSAGEGVMGNKTFQGRIGYAAGPFDAAIAYGTTQVTPSVDGNIFNVAGSFNGGAIGKFSAFYGELEVSNLTQKNWFVGYQIPFGAITLKATYGEVERSGAIPTTSGGVGCVGAVVTTACVSQGDAKQFSLGFTYDLSKRTALYGTYAQIENSGTRFRSGQLVNGNTGAQSAYNTLGKDSVGYEFGVRHSF